MRSLRARPDLMGTVIRCWHCGGEVAVPYLDLRGRLVRALTDVGNTAIDTAKFGLAAFLLATCRSAAASGVLPRWLVGAGVAAAGLLIVSAVALFMDHDPFQFGGPVDLGGGIPAVLWIAALSLTIMRRSRNGGVE